MFTLCFLVLAMCCTAIAGEDFEVNLTTASYVSAVEVAADVPHGELYIEEGVVAIFTNLPLRMAGLFIGDATVDLDRLDTGPASLNLFNELDPDRRVTRFNVEKAYLNTSLLADAGIQPTGRATRIRTWDELDDEEQEDFRGIYLQAMSDAWVEDGGMGGGGGHYAGAGGGEGLVMRYPKSKEFYLAMWEKDGQRYDYRVDVTGTESVIRDMNHGVDFYRAPWSPEEAKLDDNVRYNSISYSYFFSEGNESTPGRTQLAISAVISVESDADLLGLVSYPWLDFSSVKDGAGGEYDFRRGGIGYSDWQLRVEGDFIAGEDYSLLLFADVDVPDSFSGIGYGGVYRFDTAALWPGEDQPVDISISVQTADPSISVVAASEGATETVLSEMTLYSWKDSTRSQMVVATSFPSRNIDNQWGSIEVFAPAGVIDGIDGLGYVASLGDMMSYFTHVWGEPSPASAAGDRSLNVFLIPDEMGVQAFEDAGMVFILGNRSGIPLVAHEVAHIWWGQGFSGPRWFQEGMANYAAAKFLAEFGDVYGEDSLSYRRYLINFGLASELPLSMDRRDELDDSAAIYHNSAGFLLTLDNRLQAGLDPVLADMYTEHAFGPAIPDTATLGSLLSADNPFAAELFGRYIVDGLYDHVDSDDDTFREMVHTPSRDDYADMLSWLNPTYRKMSMGDYPGALYCSGRALEFRSEPKDHYLFADLTLRSGDPFGAEALTADLLASEDAKIAMKTHWLLSRIHRANGNSEAERIELGILIDSGASVGLMREVQQATARLAELDG